MRAPKATIFGSYGYGWQQIRKFFLYVFLIGLIVGIASFPKGMAGWPASVSTDGTVVVNTAGLVVLQILVAAYSLLILPVVEYGGSFMYLKFMRDERADVGGIFDGFRTNYLNIILANLLVFAIVGIGILLLIVPGIVFACRLAFVPYLVMDKGLDPVAAVEKSWNMTRGHGWRIFGMYLLAILVFVLGLLVFVIGAFFAVIWISCAFASLYHAVDIVDQARLNQNGAA